MCRTHQNGNVGILKVGPQWGNTIWRLKNVQDKKKIKYLVKASSCLVKVKYQLEYLFNIGLIIGSIQALTIQATRRAKFVPVCLVVEPKNF